jgi:hypothetical protein
MDRIGVSVHIDCNQLSEGITPAHPGRTYYLPGRLTVTVAGQGGGTRGQKGSYRDVCYPESL